MNSACLEEANQTLAAITHSQIQIITDIEFIILPLLQQNRRYSSDSNQCKTITNFLSPKSRFDCSMYSRDPFLNMFGLAGGKRVAVSSILQKRPRFTKCHSFMLIFKLIEAIRRLD